MGTLFSSAPSPRPSRPYSARPRLYALPVEEGERRGVAEGMLRVGHVSTYICGSWSPIPRVVRSEVSFSVLGEAWENPPQAPIELTRGRTPGRWGTGATLVDPQPAQSMEQAQVPSTAISRVWPGLCPGNTPPPTQRWTRRPYLLNPCRLYGAGHQRSPPRTSWSS